MITFETSNNTKDLNALKQECQDLMPLVNLLKNKAPANSLSGLERDQKLSIMGFSPEQIEEMTGNKSATPLLNTESSKESNRRYLGKELFEKMEALNARTDAEFEQEYNRMMVYGMATGMVEDEPILRINQHF